LQVVGTKHQYPKEQKEVESKNKTSQSVNQSKRIYTAPRVASESEAQTASKDRQ